MENRKRNVQIIVRATEEERALIEEKMKQIPTINLSAYSRKMLIDGYIILLDTSEIKAHTAQLQKIGVNINQIARRINETGRIYADDMDEIKRLMEEVWRLEHRLLLQFKGLTKRGFGKLPNKQNAAATDGHFTGTAIRSLCLLRNCKHRFQRKGMERKRILKNGHIVVKNPLAHELPKREVVIKSGRTLYRFTGSYDGQRALK